MFVRFVSLLVLLGVATEQKAVADLATDRAYVSQLLTAGKYEQAELVCREGLGQEPLSSSDRANYTCQLLHVLTERARRAKDAENDTQWEAARRVADEYLHANGDSPRSVLVRLQIALTDTARVEQLLGNVRATSNDVKTALQMVARDLQQLGTEIDARMRSRSDANPNEDGYLDRKSLRAIRASIRQRRAQALLMLAATEGISSADCSFACSEARDDLEKIAPGDLSEPNWWRSRIALAACHRLRKDFASGEKVIEEIQSAPSAKSLQPLVDAERLRAMMAREQWEEVRQFVGDAPHVANPELAMAQFEALLMLSERAQLDGARKLASSLRKRAADVLPQMESQFGSSWRRRAERLLLKSQPKGDIAPDDLTLAMARSLLSQGNPTEAADKLMAAARNATVEQRTQASRYAIEAAAIAWDSEMWSAAESYYLEAATLQKHDEAKAAEAHLMAIRAAARLARRDATKFASYEKLLQEHLQRWPDQQPAATVCGWSAKWAEQQQDWATAAHLYSLQLQKGGTQDVADAMVECFRRAVEQGTRTREHALQTARKLLDQSKADRLPTRLAATRLYLEFARPTSREVCQSIEKSLQLVPANSQSYPLAHLLVSEMAARSGNSVPQFGPIGVGVKVPYLLETLRRLIGDTKVNSARLRKQLIERRLESGIDDISPLEMRLLCRHHAAVLLETGDAAMAIQRARQCIEDNPQNVNDQLLLVRCLLGSDNVDDRREAAELGSRLVQGIGKGSDDWFEAKLLLAEAWLATGETDRAKKLLRLTTTLHPAWGGATRKQRAESLLRSASK